MHSVYLVLFYLHRFLRSVSYRQFTRMVHGVIHDKRIPLPACPYHAICTTFKVVDDNFVGYEEDEI